MSVGNAPPRVMVIAPPDSYRTAPFIAAAQRLKVDVLVASSGEHSIVSAYVDGLHVDLSDPDAALRKILNEAQSSPFAAIVGTDDATTELAAAAARALRLPHNPPHAVRLAHRKDLARAHLEANGAPVPAHWRIDLDAQLAPQAESVRYPCVIKPIAMSASRGVIRANDVEEFIRACARVGCIVASAKDADERRYLLAEKFVPGVEVAVEGLLRAGRMEILAIFDKPDPLDGPYFEETYYITPSRLPPETQERLRTTLAETCAVYGLCTGPIHAECRINRHGIWILEVAARTIGGLCARLLQWGTGYGLEELVLAEALGRPLRAQSSDGGSGVLMIPIPRPGGILRRVEGVQAAGRVPHIEDVVIQVREGYELVPLPEGSSYLGFIYARAPSVEAAEAALRSAHACLTIVVAPLWKAGLASSIPTESGSRNAAPSMASL